MARILFIGTKTKGYFIEEIVNSKKNEGWRIDYLDFLTSLEKNTNNILMETKEGYDYIVYDTEAFIEDADVIAESIYQIYNANGTTPIVMVSTLNEKNAVTRACLNKQIRDFISTGVGTTADLKEQFIKIISGFYDGNGREAVEQTEKAIQNRSEIVKNVNTIGVAGACHRIGTTTQAIQIVKYLTLLKYKACLVELNENKYENRLLSRVQKRELSFFEKTRLLMIVSNDDEKRGFIKHDGVDIFYKPELLPDIISEGYDYIVYDYGVYTDHGFNKTSFLKDDIQIFCVAANPAEVDYVFEVAENVSYKKSKFIFSFSKENDREDLKEVFSQFGDDRAFFSDYTPDPYMLTNIKLYDGLLSIKENQKRKHDKENSSKKGFFKRKR